MDCSYMIVGSFAAAYYGEPRLTNDVDIVIEIPPEKVALLSKTFPEDAYYLPPDEILLAEIAAKGQFNIIHQHTSWKIDFVICKDSPHSIAEFKRKSQRTIATNLSAYLVTPEDLIIKKLEYYRLGGSEKHIRDITSILIRTSTDETYLTKWITTLKLQDEWAKCR